MALNTIPSYPMPEPAELPTNTAAWTPDPRRAVLLVHDMQRYFLRPLPRDTPPGRDLVTNTGALVRTCRAAAVPVIYTAQPGGMTASQRGLLNDFWGPGMCTGPEDREIIDELAPVDGEAVFTKWRYSAFARNGLLDHLRSTGRDQLVLCGVYAHVGILATAIEAFSHDIETFLTADAVADFSAEEHRMVLRYAAGRCGVVLSTASVVTAIGRAPVPDLSTATR